MNCSKVRRKATKLEENAARLLMMKIVYCSASYLFYTIGYLASIIEYQRTTTIHHFPQYYTHRSGYRIHVYVDTVYGLRRTIQE
jgi:hypothetical protein